MKLYKILLITLLIFFVLTTLFYFVYINNIFAVKPELEVPEIDIDYLENNYGEPILEEEHVEYLANELGSYSLHGAAGEDAVIIFEMIDSGSVFALIINGEAYVTQNIPDLADLIIRGEQIVIARLIRSSNLIQDLQNEVELGNIQIQIISDETTLAMKGFLTIYENLI